MENDNLKSLAGQSVNLPELDEEETENFIKDSSINYDFTEFLESIGKDNFKEIFYITIPDIIKLESKKQVSFCNEIFGKIKDVYDFEFSKNIYLSEQDDFNEVYNLIRYIEFEYIGFFFKCLEKITSRYNEIEEFKY